MHPRTLSTKTEDSVEVFKALASSTRLRILSLLAGREMNIHELGTELEISQPSVTKHIQQLEDAGLVKSDYSSGIQGLQKRCHLTYDHIAVQIKDFESTPILVEDVEMPVGLYSLANPTPSCGLMTCDHLVGLLDDPQAFHHPDRARAELLWMAEGFVEYVFPNSLPSTVDLQRLEFSMELCSECPHYNNDYPSDITVWVNDVEIGTWTCPGDFGGKRGRLNPLRWSDINTQYGHLKVFSVDADGTYLDGNRVSDRTLKDLLVLPHQPITLRVGVKPDADHAGGFNLFGRGFGNYEQAILMKMYYETARCRRNGSRATVTSNGISTSV
ncbi:MAG: metalloregulator ArsR/SmtB family transcription factor [Chthonomonadales bacterium]